MNIKQKVEKVITSNTWVNQYGTAIHEEGLADQIDLLYRKEIEKEIKGMKKDNQNLKKTVDSSYRSGYKWAIYDMLNILSHKKETKK